MSIFLHFILFIFIDSFLICGTKNINIKDSFEGEFIFTEFVYDEYSEDTDENFEGKNFSTSDYDCDISENLDEKKNNIVLEGMEIQSIKIHFLYPSNNETEKELLKKFKLFEGGLYYYEDLFQDCKELSEYAYRWDVYIYIVDNKYVSISFSIELAPVIEKILFYYNEELSEEYLINILPFSINSIILKSTLKDGAKEILEKYKDIGFFDVSLDYFYNRNELDKSKATVYFYVQEGKIFDQNDT